MRLVRTGCMQGVAMTVPCHFRYSASGGNVEEQSHRLPVPIMLTFGACSGLIAQTFTYPLDVVRRQMQVLGPSLIT